MVIGDIVKYNARLFPNRVGIADEHNRLTWREVNHRVNCLANAMLGNILLPQSNNVQGRKRLS